MTEPVLCLRCGCPIQEGQARAQHLREVPVGAHHGTYEAYEIPQHANADDCMVALRRKEVDRQWP